jgi:hypothetical protein
MFHYIFIGVKYDAYKLKGKQGHDELKISVLDGKIEERN